MTVKSIRMEGRHQDIGIIHLENGQSLSWLIFNRNHIPRIPFGTPINISITFEERDLLTGVDGIVWATYDPHQNETIQNALLVQNIFSETQELVLDKWRLHLLHISDSRDVEKAIDFIWRDEAGMRLKPDWSYPANSRNHSFDKWVNGQ